MHELAHALWLENKMFDYEIFEAEALESYEVMAAVAKANMQSSGESTFPGGYALTNDEEFSRLPLKIFWASCSIQRCTSWSLRHDGKFI